MTKKFQMIHTYTFDNDRGDRKLKGIEKTNRSSFGSLEKAIENANMWINKTESWIDTTVKSITIINKETNEVLWTWSQN